MKRKILYAIMIVSIVVSTGCQQKLILTEEEEDAVAQYIAKVILDNERNYEGNLVTATPTPTPAESLDSINPTSVPSSITPQTGNTSEKGNLKANADFTQIIGISELTAEFDSYEEFELFTDGVISLNKKSGKKYVMANFILENKTNKTIHLTLADNINYQLDVNGAMEESVFTFLENDLRVLNVDIDAKSKYNANVVFMISDKIDIKSANLIISKGDLTAIVKLK